MIIKEFIGKSKEEAIALAKEEMGPSVVIMNVKEVREKGFFGMFKSASYKVTAAVEEESNRSAFHIEKLPTRPASSFNAVADEEIGFSGLSDAEALKDAFAAVGEIVGRQEGGASRQTSRPAASQPAPAPVRELSRPAEPAPAPTATRSAVAPAAPAPEPTRPAAPVFTPLESMDFVQEASNEVRSEDQTIYKMLYRTLLENEVDERHINQLTEDFERIPRTSNNLDVLISNIYQKMVLKLGQPETISLSKKRPKVVFFIGPTGVGKTTTIAKLASTFKLEQEKEVAFLTADTYRIAATDQLRTYANILGSPLSVIYGAEDMAKEIEKLADFDLILVDTAGFSHKNESQREDTKKLLESLPEGIESQIYLVLSSTTKYADLRDITDSYKGFCDFALIFTKLDETNRYGNILNLRLHTGAPLSYVTTGQNVPEDIEVLDTQKLVKRLLGGK